MFKNQVNYKQFRLSIYVQQNWKRIIKTPARERTRKENRKHLKRRQHWKHEIELHCFVCVLLRQRNQAKVRRWKLFVLFFWWNRNRRRRKFPEFQLKLHQRHIFNLHDSKRLPKWQHHQHRHLNHFQVAIQLDHSVNQLIIYPILH